LGFRQTRRAALLATSCGKIRTVKPTAKNRLTSAYSWAALSLVAVLAWGWLDPFGIRQRFDWMIQDQFIQYRDPVPIHEDLVQISLDDYAAEKLGRSDQRHRLARAIRQLKRLGAKTVLIDIMFLDRGSPNSFYHEESDYDGIPLYEVQQSQALQALYTEDHLLSESLTDLNPVVIAYHLLDDVTSQDSSSQTLLEIIDLLEKHPLLEPVEIARKLGIEKEDVETEFEQACELAAKRIVKKSDLLRMVELLQTNLELTAEDLAKELNIEISAASRLFQPALRVAENRIGGRSTQLIEIGSQQRLSVVQLIPQALDRWLVIERLREAGTFSLNANENPGIPEVSAAPQVPPDDFAAKATLGYADFPPDDDGVFRKMPLLTGWDGRGLTHQTLTAYALHLGVEPSKLRLENGRIQIGSKRSIPVDAAGRISINWPMNRRHRWDDEETLLQLSVGELLKLAEYDAFLLTKRYNLRVYVMHLDNQVGLGYSGIDTCEEWLKGILQKYANGQIDDAHTTEKWFDNTRIPEALKHPRAIEKRLQAEKTNRKTVNTSDPAVATAATIITLQQEIADLEAERDRAIARLKQRVEGKLCLIGETATASTDLKRTPVGAAVPGVTINLAAINTMLQGRFLTTPGLLTAAILTIVLAGGFSWVFQRTPAAWSFAAMAVGLLLIFYGHYLALAQADILASPVLPLAGVFACFLVITTRRWWNDVREKQKVREVFQHYLHPAMVDRLTSQPELVRLGGEDAELSILFADIRGFSGIAEKLTAEQLQKYLNGFFTPMSRIAQDHDGTIDKYIGDEMMVFYGAPLPVEDHATQAALTALKMIERLVDLRKEWSEQGLPDIRIGIGINTDIVRVGNFGSDDKFDYTVIGDGVNLASRLQGTTKQYGVQLIVGENTWKRLNEKIAGREIDRILVQGKLEPTRIFNLVGVKPLEESKQKFLDQFNAGITAFQDHRWQDALALFHEAQQIDSEDRPTKIYIERCEKYMVTPPPADWSGVTIMTVK
jgi:class 3 adenylate cyclase/CHASE2 domain-containing sensor protein